MIEIDSQGVSADFNPINLRSNDTRGSLAAITIDRDPEIIRDFWRDFGNLNMLLRGAARIEALSETSARWTVLASDGEPILEWVAHITEETPTRIAWRARNGAAPNRGWVQFSPARRGGCEVRAFISYDPPGGLAGDLAAKLARKDPGALARLALRRLKQLMETGEIATTQPPHAAPRKVWSNH